MILLKTFCLSNNSVCWICQVFKMLFLSFQILNDFLDLFFQFWKMALSDDQVQSTCAESSLHTCLDATLNSCNNSPVAEDLRWFFTRKMVKEYRSIFQQSGKGTNVVTIPYLEKSNVTLFCT